MEKNLTPLLVVAAAIIRGDASVLLHQRPEGTDHAGLWEFPGGKVEQGEDVCSALVREIAEECGVVLVPAALAPVSFAVGARNPAGGVDQGEIVLLLFATGSFTGMPQSLEGGEWDWFSWEQASLLPMPPLDRELLAAVIAREQATAQERGLPTP